MFKLVFHQKADVADDVGTCSLDIIIFLQAQAVYTLRTLLVPRNKSVIRQLKEKEVTRCDFSEL